VLQTFAKCAAFIEYEVHIFLTLLAAVVNGAFYGKHTKFRTEIDGKTFL
jgi:predicted peroxiredoxin